jgi:hypothetical protein
MTQQQQYYDQTGPHVAAGEYPSRQHVGTAAPASGVHSYSQQQQRQQQYDESVSSFVQEQRPTRPAPTPHSQQKARVSRAGGEHGRHHEDEPAGSGSVSSIDPVMTADPDDESVSSLGTNAKLRSTVTIQSPSRLNESRASHRTDPGSAHKEYIDYVGGGLYCNSKKLDNLGDRRAAALGLSYIGTGLYVDPTDLKSVQVESGERKRKQQSQAQQGNTRARSASPGRRAPLPPSSTASASSSLEGVQASTEAFERFLRKYRGVTADDYAIDR